MGSASLWGGRGAGLPVVVPRLSPSMRTPKQPIPHRSSSIGGGGGGRPLAASGGAPAVGTAALAAGTAAPAAGTAAPAVGTRSQSWSRRKPQKPRHMARRCRQHSTQCRTWTCGFLPDRAPASCGRELPGACQDTRLPPPAFPRAPRQPQVAAEQWAAQSQPFPGPTALARKVWDTHAPQTLSPRAQRGQQTR